MFVQVEPEVFKWLQSLNLAKEGKRNQNNLIDLAEDTSNKLMDGFYIGLLIKQVCKTRQDVENTKKAEAIKDNSSPAIRLYNWNIINEILKALKYNLQYAEKSKIINFDPQPIGKILAFLFQLKKNSSAVEPSKSLAVDISEIGKKTLRDSINVFQFMVISISKHFKLSPQHTLNLFLDSNKYLSHLMVKGVKNSFQPVIMLLNEIKQNLDFIVVTLFCLDQQQNVTFFLNALKSCLISKDLDCAMICTQIMIDLYDQYKLNLMNIESMRKWIKNQGLNTLFFSLKKHAQVHENILLICYNFLDDQLFLQIQPTEKSILWNSDREKLQFFRNFLVFSNKKILDQFSATEYFEEWNRILVKNLKKVKQNEDILLMIAIFEEEWRRLGQKFEENQLGIPNLFINFLKGISSSSNQLLFIQTVRTLFSLMHSLGEVKNPFAPFIYRLVSGLFGSISNSQRLTFMAQNLTNSFKAIPTLPGGPLVLSLAKQLQKNISIPLLSLCKVLLSENRVSSAEGVELVQMMTRAIFHDVIDPIIQVSYGTAVIDFLFQSLDGAMNQQLIRDYLESSCQLCLAHFYSTAKSSSKTLSEIKSESGNKTNQTYISALSKHILMQNSLLFIEKAIFYNEDTKDIMEKYIFNTYVKARRQLKKSDFAEKMRKILASYYSDDDELEAQINFYTNELYPAPKDEKGRQQQKERNSPPHHAISKSLNLQTVQTEAKLIDPLLLKPSSFALKDLQKVKQKRYQLKTLEFERQKQQKKQIEKHQQFRTIMNEKRLVQSMSIFKSDVQYQSMHEIQTKKQKQVDDDHVALPIPGFPYIKLINLEKQEELSYQQDAESIMRKFKKIWRFLFYKFSGSKKSAQDFKNQEKMHMGEVWKLLKEYEFTFMKKEECFSIIRLINEKMNRKNDPQFLIYSGFEDFILQAAVFGYSRLGFSHIPPGQLILRLIEQLKRVTKEKAGSIQIYQNPEDVYFQETDVIRQYNKRLKENSQYILPEGYKKFKQTVLNYEYDLHPLLQKNISTSYSEVLQVLDTIFSQRPELGFHLIEPLTLKNQIYLAKPVLFQNLTQKMKDYKKGYLLPKNLPSQNQKNKQKSGFLSPPIFSKRQAKPYINFSLGIKLGVAEVSIKNKSIAQQVAYFMDDILDAIQSQSPVVRNKAKKKVNNEVVRRKRLQMIRIETERKLQEKNWKKRAQSVKLEVEALRQKRKQSEKAKKKSEMMMKRLKKQKEEKILQAKLQQFEKVKTKIAQKKEILMQLKEQEQQKVRQQKQEYKIGVEQYFRKRKQELKQKEQNMKQKKQEAKQKQQQEETAKKQFVKRLYYNNLKKEEQLIEKVDQVKDMYEDVWKSDEVQDQIASNRKSLKFLFDLLLKYEKSKISATNYDELGLATLSFFCLKFKIIPFMIEKTTLSKIFLHLNKDPEDSEVKKTAKAGVNFQKFEELIFLISVKSKKMLNKIVQKRQKRQKKMQAFVNAQKAQSGNHFQPAQIQQSSSSSSSQSSDEEKPTLMDEYLFNVQDVTGDTVKQVYSLLRLPKDKLGVEERYKQVIESKNNKPKNILIRQLKATLQQ